MIPILAHTEGGAHPSGCGAPRSPGGGSEARTAGAQQERQQPAPEGALDTYAEFAFKPGNVFTEIRRVRFKRRRKAASWLIAETREKAGLPAYTSQEGVQETWLKPPRLARCSWRIGPTVRVQETLGGRAGYANTERCESPWACAVCAPVIRAERAREIGEVFKASTKRGWSGLFLTLTLRHSAEMPLQETLSLLLDAWRKLTGRRDFKKIRGKIGFQGSVKALEITHGRSGWHPHLHLYLIGTEEISPELLKELHEELFRLWKNQVERLGKTTQIPTEAGFDLKPVTGAGIGRYLAKVGGKLGAELARGDLKTARAEGSVSPLELLDSNTHHARELFLEFYRATKGRGSIVFSRGLRKILNLGEEKTAEEILDSAEDATDDAPYFVMPGKAYDRLRITPGALVRVLEIAEKSWSEAARRYGMQGEAPPLVAEQRAEQQGAVKGGEAGGANP